MGIYRTKIWCLAGLLGGASALAHGPRSQPAVSTACQWLFLRTRSSVDGRSPYYIEKDAIYDELRRYTDNVPALKTLFPDLDGRSVTSGGRNARYHQEDPIHRMEIPEGLMPISSIQMNFGRLGVQQREQIIGHLIDRHYAAYASATQKFRHALDELNNEILTPTDEATTARAWGAARGAEESAVAAELTLRAHLESTQGLLGDESAASLKPYQTTLLRPEYGARVWHISAPLAEQMLLMAVRKQGGAEWQFSKHAVEQSDLRGFSEQIIRKGLRYGTYRVLEARPDTLEAPYRSLRFKIEISGFTHEGRPKKIVVITRFEKNYEEDHGPLFKAEIITAWNQNLHDRYKDGLLEMAEAEKISLKNVKFRGLFKTAANNFYHELTYYSVSEQRAKLLIESLTKNVGRKHARAVVRYTLAFMRKEMAKANVGDTVRATYERLYSESLGKY